MNDEQLEKFKEMVYSKRFDKIDEVVLNDVKKSLPDEINNEYSGRNNTDVDKKQF